MSDGVGKNRRDSEHRFTTQNSGSSRKKKPSGIDDFAQAITRTAVAQLCESAGFQSFQQSALDNLSHVAVQYIREIGKAATFYANLAGRTECNALDLIQGLEDLGSILGFAGGSDVNGCLTGSGSVRDIDQYVSVADEIPYAYLVPKFPVLWNCKPNLSFAQAGETPPDENIPAWLPTFPDTKTYTQAPSGNKPEAKSSVDKIGQVEEHGKMQTSLLNLQKQITNNGSEEQIVVDDGEAANVKSAADRNPFLLPPLQLWEKGVSSVFISDRFFVEAPVQNCAVVENRVSSFEMFVPAVEAVKSGLCGSEEGRTKILPDRRSTVQLKFGMGKKHLGKTIRFWNAVLKNTASWFGDNSETNAKKRRREQILKESMENLHEWTYL